MPGIPNGFEYGRLLKHIRAMEVGNNGDPKRWTLCVRDKEEVTLYNMFNVRYDLFRKGMNVV